ncbi:hypothetical protein GOV05_03735 [Candidatus Woesearchaeota archaeon]|nr:hypothetical protein [Candidatus Woesearchaeota archaeon]
MNRQENGLMVFALTRISIGLIFLWAFFDKLIGLGFTTCRGETGIEIMCKSAWLKGGSPTFGFLNFASKGPFSDFYKDLTTGQFTIMHDFTINLPFVPVLVDWLFMIGLLGIGIGLIFGIAMNLSTYSGALMLFLMWTAVLPPEHHPFMDDHLIYALVLLAMNWIGNSTDKFSFAEKWKSLGIVQKHKWLG